MFRLTFFFAAFALGASAVFAQMAPTPDSFTKGLQLDAEIAQWHTDADARHYRHVLEAVNERVDKDGKLTLKAGENEIYFARAILLVCRVTRYKTQYFEAAKHIHDDLVTSTVSLLPKEAFAAVPFRVQYDVTFDQPGDIPAALESLEQRVEPDKRRDAASSDTPAWLSAAIVDTLEVLPKQDIRRSQLVTNLASKLSAVSPATTLSGMSFSNEQAFGTENMIVTYAVEKALRLGFLSEIPSQSLKSVARFERPSVVLRSTSEMDAARFLAKSEETQRYTGHEFPDKNVTIDAWFNSQTRPTPAGNTELFHYKWDDEADSGYSFFGRAFQRFGAHLTTLAQEPTAQNLAASQVYIIVSPDIPAKNPHPHYVGPQDVEAITKWVANGGVLLLLHNDNTNTEFEHFNTLTERFGIHYNPVLRNPVEGTKWVQAQVPIPAKTTGVFQDAHLAYMKEIDTISTQPPAEPVLRDTLHGTGDVYMAVSHYGKGVVFATVDSWLYNEYTDGQKLGFYDVVHFDPFPAAIDLAHWALQQTHKP